jgi:hypothetical protein
MIALPAPDRLVRLSCCARPPPGVAIAQALLEALLGTGARVAITTHYVQLKELAQTDPRFTVGAMEVRQPPVVASPGRLGRTRGIRVDHGRGS